MVDINSTLILPKVALMQRAIQDVRLWNACRTNLTGWFYHDVELRAIKNLNIILSWYGAQGSGKSLGEFFVCDFWGKKTGTGFTWEQVTFTNDELLHMFEKGERKTIYAKDEQVDAYGRGSEREKSSVESVGAVARAQQLSLIYCSPDLQLHNVHYILEATGIYDDVSKTNMHIVYDGVHEIPMGYILTKIPNLPKEFWDHYDLKKDNYITAVRMMEVSNRTSDYEKIAHEAVEKFVVEEDLTFSSKDALVTTMMAYFKKNYTESEWLSIRQLFDMECKRRKLDPYNFPVW